MTLSVDQARNTAVSPMDGGFGNSVFGGYAFGPGDFHSFGRRGGR